MQNVSRTLSGSQYIPQDISVFLTLNRVVFSKRTDKHGNGDGKPYLFRTYRNDASVANPYNPGPPRDCYIWQAGRATSAAPRYLEGIALSEEDSADEDHFVDGAAFCNDPSHELFEDVLAREGINKSSTRLSRSVMLTLGTGLKPGAKEKTGGILGKVVPTRMHKFLRIGAERFSHDGPIRHDMENAMICHNGFKWYKWYGGLEVGAMGLDKSKSRHFDRMNSGIGHYMTKEDIIDEVLDVALRLVAERRRRFKLTPDKWTRYAGATLVQCPLLHCKADEKIFGTRKMAAMHVQNIHPDGEYGGNLNNVDLTQPFLRGPWHRIEFLMRKAKQFAEGQPVDTARRGSRATT